MRGYTCWIPIPVVEDVVVEEPVNQEAYLHEKAEEQKLQETRKKVKEEIMRKQAQNNMSIPNISTEKQKTPVPNKQAQAVKKPVTEIEKKQKEQVEKQKESIQTERPISTKEDREAKEKGIKTAFHTFQTAAERYLRESAGASLDVAGYNAFLETTMRVNGSASAMKNPWGNPYLVEVSEEGQKIVVTSLGEKGKEYVVASYYYEGKIESCTNGFGSSNSTLSFPFQKGNRCGGDLGKEPVLGNNE